MRSRLVLNPSSLNLVRPELSRLVKQAQTEFERSLQPDESHGLDVCRALLEQADGVLRLVELGDAAQMARELADLLAEPAPAGSRAAQAAFHAFFVLNRYLDYLGGRHEALPELLVEEINALRGLQGRPPLPEAHFARRDVPVDAHAPGAPAGSAAVDEALLRRLRHMYQVGLLGLMKGSADPVNHHLLGRATHRMRALAGGGSAGDFWWFLEALLEVVEQGEIALTQPRMRVLSRADRQFRDFLRHPGNRAGMHPDAGLRADFLLLLGKARASAKAGAVLAAFGLPAGPTDHELAEERRLLMGTSVDSVDSMARALGGDIHRVKEELELAAAEGALPADALAGVRQTLWRVAGVLRDGGLAAAASSLDAQLERIAGSADGSGLARKELMSIADALVEVETMLESLANPRAIARGLREQMQGGEGGVSRQVLDAARLAMLASARETIEGVKRDVGAWVDGAEAGTLSGCPAGLGAVKGALQMLERPQAAGVAARAAAALQAVADRGESATPGFAESMADALICLEYYLSALENGENPDPLMLKLAEESLATLPGHA